MSLDVEQLENNMKSMLEYLKTPEGLASAKEFFGNIAKEKDRVRVKKEEVYDVMSPQQFRTYFLKEVVNQDLAYNAAMTKEMEDLTEAMLEYGELNENYDEYLMFEAQRSTYKGLTISLFQGQGSFVRVSDKEEIIYQSN